ncbi:hypothetical protein SERLA73DRAFT_178665 [Serpula lacrymans var. lacrymans S7.3]|uniref:Uncharacterized protein n=2 Tax=Serpula lacrymans var. lacrymans TaxID=341189 RepID=F8PSD6_SERL3|nr:uncharacterized protein SERLADRAFT_463236 [Serpula lacrymans var. lacrymans S7.9]EGO00749.1 hypothetical protein SERLA73DRAFT_178665 [Serpula lacrymans var. lacrymans S7.3]EGO26316.1 hypothetical protein SERLADRAFT_463236 [Serpula lacrymans var. lacrymans S7.9]
MDSFMTRTVFDDLMILPECLLASQPFTGALPLSYYGHAHYMLQQDVMLKLMFIIQFTLRVQELTKILMKTGHITAAFVRAVLEVSHRCGSGTFIYEL